MSLFKIHRILWMAFWMVFLLGLVGVAFNLSGRSTC